MNNWQYHDAKMHELKKVYNRISKQTQNELQNIFDSYKIDFEYLYNIADNKTLNRIKTKIEEWKDKGLLTGYFGMLANNIYKRTRVKNSEILELLIYGAYIEEQNKLEETELNIFKNVANYYYQQGQIEVNNTLPKKKRKLISVIPDAIFLALLDTPNAKGYVWNEYLESIIKYNADQIYRQATIDLQQQKELDITNDIYQNLIKRQNNSRLNVNRDTISGDVDLTLIGINNQAKLEGIYSFDDKAEVEFISIEDEKRTEMCKSLHGQRFKVHDWNEFKRYSKTNDSLVKYRCYGLIVGLNCPPINDGFHWCRSYIAYLPPVEKEEKTEYNIPNYLRTKIAKNYKNVLDDLKVIQKEYDMLPQNVKDRLEKENVTIVLNDNSKTSGYNPKTKEIILLPDLEEGEFIHEIGHALYYNLKVSKYNSYQNIINNIINGSIIKEYTERVRPYYGLETKYNVASNYQTFLGYDKLTAQLKLTNKDLIEVMSEAYREYYFGKNQSKELNDLVEEVEDNA